MTDKEHPWQTAASEVIRHWPIDVRAVTLVSESENIVFQVVATSGKKYVLRLHRPGYHTLDELRAEHVWIEELRRHDLNVPVPVYTSSGMDYADAEGPDESRHTGLYEWMDGDILGPVLHEDASQVTRRFAQLGSIIAAMHGVAESFSPPSGFTRHAFDTEGTMGEAPFWGRFWDHPKIGVADATMLNDLRMKIYHRLATFSTAPDTYGMIHADMHAHNILINDDQLYVIDFDDAGFGWYQFDLAVALPDPRIDDYESAKAALYEGYCSVRPVPDDFFDTVPLFSLVRSMNHIGWMLPRYPDMEIRRLAPLFKDIHERGQVLLA